MLLTCSVAGLSRRIGHVIDRGPSRRWSNVLEGRALGPRSGARSSPPRVDRPPPRWRSGCGPRCRASTCPVAALPLVRTSASTAGRPRDRGLALGGDRGRGSGRRGPSSATLAPRAASVDSVRDERGRDGGGTVASAGVAGRARRCDRGHAGRRVLRPRVNATIPDGATTYAVPDAWRARTGRPYGFPGRSHSGSAARAARCSGARRIATAHSGAEVSPATVLDRRRLHTRMEFAPPAGVVMATRPGPVVVGPVVWLPAPEQMSAQEARGAPARAGTSKE
jgi:hypothetical protein